MPRMKNIDDVAGGSTGPTGPTKENVKQALMKETPTESFACRACDRVFASSRGRGVHEQKQHKSWYDQQQVQSITNKKAPWSAEEAALLARQEAHLTLAKERFINQALQPFFPNRTLEAIKGQRRNLNHKERVLQILREMEQQSEVPLNTAVASVEQRSDEVDNGLIDKVTGLFDELKAPKDEAYCFGKLNWICNNLKQWPVLRTLEELEIYLLQIFPRSPKTRLGERRVRTDQPLTKRKARRFEYARTQRAWKRNPCTCLRMILKDKETSLTPSKDVMVPFWSTIMTNESVTTPGVGKKREVNRAVWECISPEEIKSAFPELNTAPGPDGLTARQLRAVPPAILTRIFNIFLLCGRVPQRLLESRTTLIPKKDSAAEPGDFRPITVSSVLTRTFHKILATRLTAHIHLDERQKAFLPVDGSAENIFKLDMVLRHHRQYFKPLYLASMDIAKAFDSVSHATIRDTMTNMGIPDPMKEYIMFTYKNSSTRITCDGWESDLIHPTCGVKQGDPLSPIIFNMVIDRLFRLIPDEIGTNIAGEQLNALAFADDLLLQASTPKGLQLLLDIVVDFLAQCGLRINTSKSFTVALRNVPHKKMSVVDSNTRFSCLGQTLPSMTRDDEWKYLGVPFTPTGRSLCKPEEQLLESIKKLSKAALKPQQRLFALRVMVLPGLYHQLVLGNTNLSRLRKIDTLVRGAVRKWLALPKDTPNAYVHAHSKDGGLSIPSMRWLMPLLRKQRLKSLLKAQTPPSAFLLQEIQIAERRLSDGQDVINERTDMEKRWAKILHSSSDGKALKESRGVPQQHQWITDGNRFLSGKDFVKATKLRINAMPTKSRSNRGRRADRLCRAGCPEIETLNHILQRCHRTHLARVKRHDACVAYIKRALQNTCEKVDEEPRFLTQEGLRKPDLVAKRGKTAMVIDAQVVSEQADLTLAHRKKADYYRSLEGAIKDRYNTDEVKFTSATISCRGLWSRSSAQDLADWKILKKADLKILSTRAIIGGIASYNIFMKTTSIARKERTSKTGVG